MAEFRSSARSIGFNAINVPDNARRLQEDGEKKVRDLRRVYEQTIRQKRQFGEQQDINNALVQQQIKDNQNLESDFQQTYKQQLLTRGRQEVEKLKKQQELDQDVYERLGTFSSGALKLGKELIEKRKEDRQAYGLSLVMEYGVTAEELEQLRQKEADLESEGAANNAIVERLKAQGASPAEIKRIRDLNGWALYGARKAIAMSAKDNWFAFSNNPERRNKKYDVNGTEMSLQEAEDAGLTREYANIYGQMRAEFLKPYSDYDPAFAEKYLFPGMRTVDSLNKTNYYTKLREQNEENEREDLINDISTEVLYGKDKTGLERVIKDRARDGGPLAGFYRDKTLETMIYMVENGYDITSAQVAQIGTQEFTINGKTVTFAEQFLSKGGANGTTAALYKRLTRLVEAKELDEFKLKREQRAARAAEFELDFISRIGDSQVNITTAQSTIKYFKEEFPGVEMSEALKRVLTNQATGLENKLEFQMAMADTDITVAADVTQRYPSLSKDQKEIIFRKNRIDSKTGTQISEDVIEDSSKIISNAMETAIEAADSDAGKYKVMLALPIVMEKFQKDLQILKLKEPNRSIQDLANELAAKYVDQFTSENPKDNFFAVKGTGADATFLGVGQLDTSYADIQNQIIANYTDNPESLFTGPAFGKPGSPLVNDMTLMAEDKVPRDWILNLANQLGQSWKTLYNVQAPFYGLEPIALERHEEVQELLDPRVRPLLTRRPSPATLQHATSQHQRLQGATGLEVYRPILDLIASEESANDVEMNGYDAMNLGGTNGGFTPIGTTTGSEHFKRPLTDFTVGEIYELQKSGQLHAAGRYQFVEIMMRDMIESRGFLPSGVSLDSKFDEATQDLMAVAYFRRTIQDYKNSNGNLVYGLGQRWIGLNNVNQEELKRIVEQIQNDPRYQTPGFQAYEVSPEYEAARQLKYGVA